MSNEQLYEAARAAIVELFADVSVSVEECRINLNTLIGEIEVMRDSLPEIPEIEEDDDFDEEEEEESFFIDEALIDDPTYLASTEYLGYQVDLHIENDDEDEEDDGYGDEA